MSLTKRFLESQPEFEQNQNVLLSTAVRDIRRAARIVNSFDNLTEVNFSDLSKVSESLNLALTTLSLLEQQEVPNA
jgi:hypothetical protein